MANSYSFTGGERWSDGDATAEDKMNLARQNADYLEEALSSIMDPDAADGRFAGTLTEAAAASVKVMVTSEWDPASGTPAVGQGIRWQVKASDLSNNQDVVGAIDWVATNVTHGAEDYRLDFYAMKAGAMSTARMSLSSAALYPGTNDGLSLGIANTGEWSDLRLASGAVIGWDNSAMAITHSSGVLAFSGGRVTFNSSFSATSNIAFDMSPTFAPSSASNDFVLQMLPAVTLDNAGTFYGQYSRLPTVSAGKTLASAKMYHVADAVGSGTTSQKIAYSNDVISGGYAHYSAGGHFFSADGYRVGADDTGHLIDDASNGGSSSTLYIGNQSITTSSDIRVKKDIRPWDGIDPEEFVRLAAQEVIGHEYDAEAINDTSPYGPASRGRYPAIPAQKLHELAPWAVNAGDAVNCPTCRAGLPCADHKHIWKVEAQHLIPLLILAAERQRQQIANLQSLHYTDDEII